MQSKYGNTNINSEWLRSSLLGQPNGIAELGPDGLVPSSQLGGLDNLLDVEIALTSLTDGDVLTYDFLSGTWTNLPIVDVTPPLADVLAEGYITGPNPIHVSGGQNISFLDGFGVVKGFFKQADVSSDATAFRNNDGLVIGKIADDGVNELGVTITPNGRISLSPSAGEIPFIAFGTSTWAGSINIVPATQTASHTATLQNASGTLAYLSDIPAPTQAGHVIYDAPSPTPLTQRTKLVFTGTGVTATDANDLTYGNHTLVNIPGADGNGIFDAANDGGTVPTGFDVNLTDTFTFNTNLLKIDAGVNKNIGIGTAFPQAYTKINVVTTEPGQYIAMQIVSNTGTNVNEAIRAEATSSNPVINFGLVARAGLASSRNVGIQGNVTGGNTTLANIAVEGNCAATNIGSAGNNGKNYGFETYVDNANSQNVGQLIQVGTQVNIGGNFDTGSEIYMSNTGSLANTSYGMRIQQTKTDTTTKYGAFINTYEIGGTRSTGTTYGLRIQANDNFTSSGNLYALDIAGFAGTNLANAVAIRTTNGDVNFRTSGDLDLFYLDQSTDNIGISTNLPTAKLHVDGSFRLSNLTTTPAAGYVLQSTDALGNADWVDPNTLVSAGGTILEEQTTDATSTELLIGGSGGTRIPVASNSMQAFEITVTAIQSAGTGTGDVWVHKFKGAIKNIGGTTSIVGTVTEETIAEDINTSTWTATVTADDTNDALTVDVTGQALKTIEWKAEVKVTENSY